MANLLFMVSNFDICCQQVLYQDSAIFLNTVRFLLMNRADFFKISLLSRCTFMLCYNEQTVKYPGLKLTYLSLKAIITLLASIKHEIYKL